MNTTIITEADIDFVAEIREADEQAQHDHSEASYCCINIPCHH